LLLLQWNKVDFDYCEKGSVCSGGPQTTDYKRNGMNTGGLKKRCSLENRVKIQLIFEIKIRVIFQVVISVKISYRLTLNTDYTCQTIVKEIMTIIIG